jgi:hypothetical protein
MSFNCSIFLQDIDLNCNANIGGISKVVLGLQKDLNIALDPIDETIVTQADLSDSVVFAHNKKDSTTVFTENKTISNGLGVIGTEITIRLPYLDNKLNKLDYMSRRNDIVCIMYHNNGTATISGWMDGLEMEFTANSGTNRGELSFIDVVLKTNSWISSLAVDDSNVINLI